MIVQEKKYKRYSEVSVWKWAKTVNTQITRNTQDPKMTMIVGGILFPIPLDAAMEQSINAETA